MTNEVREDGRIVGGEPWQGKVHNREEWKKLLRTARDRSIPHMTTEWMNSHINNTKTWKAGKQYPTKKSVFKITHRPRYRFKHNYKFMTNLWNAESENLSRTWHQILKSVLPGSTFSRRFPISWTLVPRLRCSENIHQWPVSTEFNRVLQKTEEMCKSIYTVLITNIRKIKIKYMPKVNPEAW